MSETDKDAESSKLETWFSMANSSASPELSTEDLQRVLFNRTTESGIKSYFSLETVKLLMRIVNNGTKSTINISEFKSLWTFLFKWRQLFKEYDTDGNGKMEHEEFESALVKLGFNLDSTILKTIFDRFDSEGIGSIEFDDFIRVCIVLRDLSKKFKSREVDGKPGFAMISYQDFIHLVLSSTIF